MPSRHKIRNSSPRGLRPSTLTLGHWGSSQYWICFSERGRNFFAFLKLIDQSGVQIRDLRLSSLNHCIRTLPSRQKNRNWSPIGLRPSTLTPGHRGSPQYWISMSGRGKNIFASLKLEDKSGVQTRDLRLSKQANLTIASCLCPPDKRFEIRAHNIWILSLFFLFTTSGDEKVTKK